MGMPVAVQERELLAGLNPKKNSRWKHRYDRFHRQIVKLRHGNNELCVQCVLN